MDVYVYGTAQPHTRDVDTYKREYTSQLTREEKRAFADAVGTFDAGFIPACIDHAGAEHGDTPVPANDTAGFQVPGKLQIGRLILAGVRPNGDLVTQVQLFHDRPEGRAIVEGILDRGERWGLSLCTNLKVTPDGRRILDKKITHIGLTRDPEFGDEGSWLHRAYLSWQTMDDEFAHTYLQEPGFYVHPAALERLNSRRALVTAVRQQQEQQQQMQQQKQPAVIQAIATREARPSPSVYASGENVNATAHMATPPGPAHAVHSPSPSPSIRRHMATTDAAAATANLNVNMPAPVAAAPAVTPVTTPAAAAVPSSVAIDYASKLADIDREADTRFGGLFKGQAQGDEMLSATNMRIAASLLEKYDSVLRQGNIPASETSYETLHRLIELQKYIKSGEEAVRRHLAEVQTADDPMDMDFNSKVIGQWNKNDAAYSMFQTVVANKNHGVRNQRRVDAEIRAKSAEVETLKRDRAEFEKENATLKRDRETFEQQTKQLQDEIRRLKSFEAAAATPAPAPVAISIDATASRSNAGLGTAYMSNVLPAASSSGSGAAVPMAFHTQYERGSDAKVEQMLANLSQYAAAGKKTIKLRSGSSTI